MYRGTLLVIGLLLLVGALVLNPPVLTLARGPIPWTNREVLWTVAALLGCGGAAFLLAARRSHGEPAEDLRALIRRHPRSLAMTTGLAMAFLLLALTEIAFYGVHAREHEPVEVQKGSRTEPFFLDDDLLGYRPAPNSRVEFTKQVDGRMLYDVVYTIDAAGRRITPSSGPDSADEVVLFFGCSNTFGEGVNDDETMPHYFGLSSPDRAVYNYGFCGYGPQQMLAMLQDGRLDRWIAGKSVTSVYLFIDAHVNRAAGSMVVVTTWGMDMPRYVLDDEGRPALRGSFRSGRWATSWLYALASKSYTLSHYHKDLPPLLPSHYRLTARIFEEAARLIGSKARTSRFYLVLHPTVKAGPRLVRELAGSEVRVLDFSGLWASGDTRYMIAGDWHPTPLAHETLAGKLSEAILDREP